MQIKSNISDLIKPTLKGVIEAPDGIMTVTFKRERLNEGLKLDSEIEALETTAEKNKARMNRVLNLIESIEGVDITPEELRAGNCYQELIVPIIICYYEAAGAKLSEAAEKKELSSSEL